jgi:DNA modification methylase
MCVDSTSIDAVETLLSGSVIDCVVTDPPYNQETEGGFKHDVGAALKKQSGDIGFMCDFEPETWLPVVAASFPKGKMNATIFCNKDLVPEYLSWARSANYSFNILVWKKPNAIPLGGSYMPDVEYCLVFRKSGVFNGAIPEVSYSKVLSYGRERGLHPTMKPVDMLRNQILIVSNAGGVVLDYFGGSGSTMIACEKTNRDCRMMELDPRYCDVIIKRWQDFTGQKATLEATGQTYDELKQEREAA